MAAGPSTRKERCPTSASRAHQQCRQNPLLALAAQPFLHGWLVQGCHGQRYQRGSETFLLSLQLHVYPRIMKEDSCFKSVWGRDKLWAQYGQGQGPAVQQTNSQENPVWVLPTAWPRWKWWGWGCPGILWKWWVSGLGFCPASGLSPFSAMYCASNKTFSYQKSIRHFSWTQLLLHLIVPHCPALGLVVQILTFLHSVPVCPTAHIKNLGVRALTLLLTCLFPFRENKLFKYTCLWCNAESIVIKNDPFQKNPWKRTKMLRKIEKMVCKCK